MSEDWGSKAEDQEAKELSNKVDKLLITYIDQKPVYIGTTNEIATVRPPPIAVQPSPVAVQPSPVAVQPSPVAVQPSPVAVQPSPVAVQPSPVNVKLFDSKPDEETTPTPADISLMRKALCRGIIESKNNVEILQKDPNSPLYSIKTFEELKLRKELLEGIYSLGFKLPSKIQEKALPTLLANPPQNLIAQSQSGTGKTAAFSLAMLSRIKPSERYTQALCLSPTYELALQTMESVKCLGKFCTDIKLRCAVKGERISRGDKITEHIVIGTPGKVVDWVIKLRCLDISRCKVFVLDEADVMMSIQGHQDQSVRIYKHLPKICQKMLFSATYDDDVIRFAEAIITERVVMTLKREEETLDNIRQMYVECTNQEEKYTAITNIYTIPVGQSMFFCRTKVTAHALYKKMQKDGHHVAVLTGDLTAEERLNVLDRYRQGKERVLICTNVLARGIDVEQVTLVVNYDLPDIEGKVDCETYLHRIGRTGRFGKNGNAINIIDSDKALRMLREIESHFNIKIKKLDYRNFDEIDKLGED